jgi:hypothetical protein
MLELARTAAANWNGKQALVASKRGQKSTFSSAKAATTFRRSTRRLKVTKPITIDCSTPFDTRLLASGSRHRSIAGQGFVRRRRWLRDASALPPATGGVAMQKSHYVADTLSVDHPRCKECGVPMWLTRLEPDKPDHNKRTFECKVCGASVTEIVNTSRPPKLTRFRCRVAS